MAVERTLGLLNGRFRQIIHYLDIVSIGEIVQCIFAACKLHELALGVEDDSEVQDMVEQGILDLTNREDRDVFRTQDTKAGRERRDRMMNYKR